MLNKQTTEMAEALISSRQSFLPKRLFQPGPSPAQLEVIFTMAASAPDHNLTRPWRIVICPQESRGLLADAFARALFAASYFDVLIGFFCSTGVKLLHQVSTCIEVSFTFSNP